MRTKISICLAITLILAAAGCRKKPAPTTSLLHWAAQTGNVQRVKSLLTAGADANAKDQDGWTPLHWAAHKGRIDAVNRCESTHRQWRRREPNDVNLRAKKGWTPLFLALPTGNEALIEVLIANGAEPNAFWHTVRM